MSLCESLRESLRDWWRHLSCLPHDHDHGGWEDLTCSCECTKTEEP